MRRDVIVVRLLPDDRAEVAMERPSACGGNCASCGGCADSRVLAVADNRFGASLGEEVVIEGAARRLIAMTAMVYLLPLALLAAGWGLSELLWQRPGPGAAVGLALGIAAVVLYGRRQAKQPPVYRIVARR